MRTKKFIVALCFSFFMFMCSVSTVYAYNTYNQHKLTYGVGNYEIMEKIHNITLLHQVQAAMHLILIRQ